MKTLQPGHQHQEPKADGIDPILRIHKFIPLSYANGPGRRAVFWTQGCSLGCLGCFNSDTHHLSGGRDISLESLISQILALDQAIEGITISGGEPLQQRAAVTELLRRIRSETSLSAIMFTGYTWNEIQQMPGSEFLLGSIDVLISGRYNVNKHLARNLIGSANQTLDLLTDRYSSEEIESVPSAEVVISENGEIVMSGIDPLGMELIRPAQEKDHQ
jgi:anaerobic ribonucleoside-triphosphate reductase activating protein